MSADPVEALRRAAGPSLVSSSSLSADGRTLTLGSQTFDATARLSVRGVEGTYSLASTYLQIVDPSISLLKYRQECKKYNVEAGVKASDKAALVGYFYEASPTVKDDDDMEIDEEDVGEIEVAEKSDDGSQKDRDRDRDRDHDRGGEERHRRDKEKQRNRDEKDRARRHSDKHRGDGDRDHGKHRRSSDKHDKDRDRHRDRDRDRDTDRHHHGKHRRQSENHGRQHHRDKDRRHSHEKHDRHHRDEEKKHKAPITNEQLMGNLDIVVDKRNKAVPGEGEGGAGGQSQMLDPSQPSTPSASGNGAHGHDTLPPTPTADLLDEDVDEAELLVRCLSSAGFEVRNLTAEIKADRPAVERITAGEIPVGNSASVLRCGDGKRDFSRVLELFDEVRMAEQAAKKGGRGHTPGGSGGGKRPHPPPGTPGSDQKRSRRGAGSSGSAPVGRPIIVVPNAMTSPITMVNVQEFLGKAVFVPRTVMLKKSGGKRRLQTLTIRRKVSARLGGGEVEYEIIDNPLSQLKKTADWDRIVAIIPQGASWQFKGWKYETPVDIFSRCFGYYIGMEGAPIPKEISGWAVKQGWVNRDKRGMDSVTVAGFWNG